MSRERGGYNPEEEKAEISSRVAFNPERRPGIPRGAFAKGETAFHKRAKLWDAAKAEFDAGNKDSLAIKKYEDYATWMENQYALLTESMDAASEAVSAAGLTQQTEEGRKLYDETRSKFLEEHKEDPSEV